MQAWFKIRQTYPQSISLNKMAQCNFHKLLYFPPHFMQAMPKLPLVFTAWYTSFHTKLQVWNCSKLRLLPGLSKTHHSTSGWLLQVQYKWTTNNNTQTCLLYYNYISQDWFKIYNFHTIMDFLIKTLDILYYKISGYFSFNIFNNLFMF